ITLSSCGSGSVGDDNAEIIDRPEVTINDGIFTVEALEALGRVSGPVVSPDGTRILYTVSYESVEQNKSNADLYVMNIDGTEGRRLTRTARSESSATWIDGGKRIAFIAVDNGKPQLWVMNADGSDARVASGLENGVEGFLFSPDGRSVLLVSTVKYGRTAQDVYPDLPKATGRIIDDLMYKHWDEWVVEIPHPFLAAWDGSKIVDPKDIMADEPFESPMKPFGGIESFSWSPDSKSFVYVSRKKTGLEYAVSTDSNLYLYNIADGSTRCLTEGMMGYDTNPAFSPDGTKLAWLSMEHDGYESDKNRIFTLDMASGEKTDLTADWDYTADAIAWRPDGKAIYFIAAKDGVTPIFSIDVESHEVKVVADGQYDYAGLAPAGNGCLVTLRHSMVEPNEVYAVNTDDGNVTRLTYVNTELLARIEMPRVELRQVPTTDGKSMATWVIYPPKFDPARKYPAILYCQGGPQQAVSQFWSYRWNFALMASNGYIVIAPNRRGLPGFGTEWNAQISKDYPGQNMRDYLSAVDYMK
ncbi:MAG: prolyl oligopeptidase family serine peptidase, partial [Muribaculaceae bacterium]|nr:prolyl oligopeptidase family serine peptidase [Muribaculaceae bacterium]